MGSLVGLDANIFIYTLEGNATFGQAASQVLRAVADGRVDAVASELVYLEVLSGKNVRGSSEITRVNALLDGVGVAYHGIDRQVLVDAAQLRREHGIKTPDAIHLASAILAGCTHFVTNDTQLLGCRVPGLRLVALTDVDVSGLFAVA